MPISWWTIDLIHYFFIIKSFFFIIWLIFEEY